MCMKGVPRAEEQFKSVVSVGSKEEGWHKGWEPRGGGGARISQASGSLI